MVFTATTFAESGEAGVSIDPKQMQDNVNVLSNMMQQLEEYAISVLQEGSIDDPLGSGSEFSNHQQAAKEHAETWLYDINNQMFEVVSDIVDYSNDFDIMYNQAKGLIDQLPDDVNASQELITLLSDLKGEISEKLVTVDQVQPKLTDFNNTLSADVSLFQDDYNEAESQISHEQNQIVLLQNDIDDLNAKMEEQTPVTICNYFGCTVTWVDKYDNNQLQQEISDDEAKINDANVKIKLLRNFQSQVQNLIDNISTVANTLTLINIRDAWEALDYNFELLINVLNKTDVEDQPILLRPQMDQANSRWQDIEQIALALQDSIIYNDPLNILAFQSLDQFKTNESLITASNESLHGQQVWKVETSEGKYQDENVYYNIIENPKKLAYTFSIWLKADDEHTVTLGLRNNEQTEGGQQSFTVTTEWKKYEVTAPFELDSDHLVVYLYPTGYDVENQGYVYASGVSLTKKKQLLDSPNDFTKGYLSYWYKDTIVEKTKELSPVMTYPDTSVNKITPTGLNNKIYQETEIDPVGKTYKFGIWLKADQPHTSTIKVQNADYSESKSISINVTKDWQYFEVSKEFTNHSDKVTVLLWPGGYNYTTDSVYAWGASLVGE
nr:HBL/NHE enterotoxin family protein [Chengkuizengella sediminis]